MLTTQKMMAPFPENKELNLLSIDGGGVRGLSALYVLKQIMDRANEKAGNEVPLEPYEYFNMIAGTSTGGIIAIMLGRLQMSVQESIDTYLRLADTVFRKIHSLPLDGRLNIRGRLDHQPLEEAVRNILRDKGLPEDTKLKNDEEYACRVFVCALRSEFSAVVPFSTYKTSHVDSEIFDSATILQACRATSAASTYFEPLTIYLGPEGGKYPSTFIDAAVGGNNNPIRQLWRQAQDVWEDPLETKINCVVSIGTGKPSLSAYGPSAKDLARRLQEIATESDQTARQFYYEHRHALGGAEPRYFRFTVERGLENVGLDESTKKGRIIEATKEYLNDGEVFDKLEKCAERLAPRQTKTKFRRTKDKVLDAGFRKGKSFVTRESLTRRMDQFSRASGEDLEEAHAHLVYGLGGMGKTQLCRDYYRRHRAEFDMLLWVDASTQTSMDNDLLKLARDWQKKEDIPAVMSWLSTTSSTWVLVLDNISNASAPEINNYLPPTPKNCLIIMTSLSNSLQDLATAGTLEVSQMTQGEAIELLLAAAGIKSENCSESVRTDATSLVVEDLGRVALATDLAGSYIKKQGMSIAEYQRYFRDDTGRLEQLSSAPKQTIPGYTKSLLNAWTISFEAVLNVEQDARYAADLLHFFSLLHSNQIPTQILLESWNTVRQRGSEHISEHNILLVKEAVNGILITQHIRASVNLLADYSLVTVSRDSHNWPRYVSMQPMVHKMVYDWAREKLSTHDGLDYRYRAISTMALALEPRDPGHGGYRYETVPHIEHLISPVKDSFFTMPFKPLTCFEYVFTFADVYSEAGFPRKAMLLLKSLCAKTLGHLPNDIPRYAQALRQLARNHVDLGEPKKALEYRREAFEKLKSLASRESLLLLSCKGELSDSLEDMGSHNEAFNIRRELYDTLQDFWRLEEYHPEIGRASRRLANSYKTLGDNKKASEILHKVIAAQKKSKHNRDDNHDYLFSLSEHAQAYEMKGDLQEATRLYEEILTTRTDGNHNAHDVLAAKEDVANIYSTNHQYQRALSLRQEIVQTWKELHNEMGDHHPNFLAATFNLGKSLADNKNYEGSLAEHEKVLKIRQQRLGEDHPCTLRSKQEKAYTLRRSDEPDKAFNIFKEVSNRCEKILTQRHNDKPKDTFANSQGSVGNCRSILRLSTADTSDSWDVNYDKYRRIAVQARNEMATTLRDQGELDEAILGREGLLEDQKTLDPNLCSESTLWIMYELIRDYVMNKQDKDAKRMGERALNLQKQYLGDRHWLTCDTMIVLSSICRKENSRDSCLHAIELLESSYAIQITNQWWPESIESAKRIWRTLRRLREKDREVEAKIRLETLKAKYGDHGEVAHKSQTDVEGITSGLEKQLSTTSHVVATDR